jgi:hypothetical protein
VTATLEAPKAAVKAEAPKLIEEEIRDKVQESVDAFAMPKPMRGQSVLFYRNGQKTGEAEVGFVLKVAKRNIVINLASGLAYDSVRHVDDPKLQVSVEQRSGGAWDYTDDWKEIQALRKDVTALTAQVTELLK